MIEKLKNNYKVRRIVSNMLIILGIALFIGIITINVRDISKSIKAVEEFNEKKGTEKVTDDEALPAVENQLANEDSDAIEDSDAHEDVEDKELICLLRIPKIALEEAVREGDSKDVLSSALCHLEMTAYPGKQGNCCISGHRNYVFGKYFNRLNEVSVGDIVELETMDATYRYQVYETLVVDPEDVKVLDSTGEKTLTLITCTPLFIGTNRLIVKATLVE